MEHGTDNPELSRPQSACTCAYAAAEPGDEQGKPVISPDLNHWSSISPSFVNQQLGDSNSLSRSALAENNRISLLDYGHYNAYDSAATPGNYTDATQWATSPPDNHVSGPSINSDPLQSTGSTFPAGFAAGADDNDGTALPTAPIPYPWEAAAPITHWNNNAFTSSISSNPSPLIGSTFANAAYDGGITYPTASNAYTGLAGAPAGPMNNNAVAPFVNSNLSPLPASSFAANAAYDGGNTYPTAPSPYALGAAASMYHYMGPGFHYPNPALPMMDPFAPDTNGNAYQFQFSTATSFNTQFEAAIATPTASHATHNNDTAPLVLAQQQPPPPTRPTCAICARNFRRKADLDRHAKSHRADARVFRCGCGYDNYRKDKLDEHVRRSGHRAAAAVVSGDGL